MSIKLDHEDLVIAVTGLKTGDNPQPGVPIIRSIRNAGFKGKIVGLIYDNLESGVYVDGIAQEVYQMPYPAEGKKAILTRLDYILKKTKIDILIPSLDSEIIGYIRMEKELKERGIVTFLPTEEQLKLRDKSRISKTFPSKGIKVPLTEFLTDIGQVYGLEHKLKFPLFIKGSLYEAYKCNNINEALYYFNVIKNKWGLPILAQQQIIGDEFNISLVGDGEGGMLGMIPQRKLIITDKGKGFGGVVVSNPDIESFAKDVVKILKWKGPCELELMKDYLDNLYLIEINPRFPAWIKLAEGAGQNLPAMVVKLALGEDVEPFTEYKTGTIFLRHAEDVISHINLMGQLATSGEIIRGDNKNEKEI
ncbi:MAG: biotin carboxylase [Candidatus Cloacimonetes bacterium 4572_65]|nr:MAG: biotin carboxylase [Candidatus Cloacimonetes bacterium 4572_65]